MKTVELYTDGGCRPTNPGPGTCGFIVVHKNKEITRKWYRKKEETTNNRMELSAVIVALQWAIENEKDANIYLFTDSQYVQKGITDWLPVWKNRNWKGSNRKPISNIDLWKKVDAQVKQLSSITVQWIRGHAGNKWNVEVDKLING